MNLEYCEKKSILNGFSLANASRGSRRGKPFPTPPGNPANRGTNISMVNSECDDLSCTGVSGSNSGHRARSLPVVLKRGELAFSKTISSTLAHVWELLLLSSFRRTPESRIMPALAAVDFAI